MFDHVFVGFGFGPIQSGLFAAEAFKSGNFRRIVIAEIDQNLVKALRENNGSYQVNVARSDGIVAEQIDGVEIYNPTVQADQEKLLDALTQATEIVTSLPSVKFYDSGNASVAKFIAHAVEQSMVPATIIYAAENSNHAAEVLEKDVANYTRINHQRVQFLNTVIGKMSQVTDDKALIRAKSLETITGDFGKAFLVEEFNRIMVTKAILPDFQPGIRCFLEKSDLLPFEEAKLFGHNAIHAMLAYLGIDGGYETMDQLQGNSELIQIARTAFIEESGRALIKKYSSLSEELFTLPGYTAFAEDLLQRMTNPFLADSVDRAARDPLRKLGFRDRIFGTMRLALEYGIEPVNMAKGAQAGLKYILSDPQTYEIPQELCFNDFPLSFGQTKKLLNWLWDGQDDKYSQAICELVAS